MLEFGQQASTVEDWVRLADSNKALALLARGNPRLRMAGWSLIGHAVEAMLKASIMAELRWNQWPSLQERRELYTHDLAQLAEFLNWRITPIDPVAPAWAVTIQWRRSHSYHVHELSAAEFDALVEAAFSEKGVVECLRRTYLTRF